MDALGDAHPGADAENPNVIVEFTPTQVITPAPGHFRRRRDDGRHAVGGAAELAGDVARRGGHRSITVSGGLSRPGGDRVLDVRGLQVSLAGEGGASVVIEATSRLAFRDLVRPGETVIAEITVDATA